MSNNCLMKHVVINSIKWGSTENMKKCSIYNSVKPRELSNLLHT